MPTIEIPRKDPSVSQLRAAPAGGMARQTPRGFVIRANADGLAELVDRPRPRRRPRLAEAKLREVAKWIERGPHRKTGEKPRVPGNISLLQLPSYSQG